MTGKPHDPGGSLENERFHIALAERNTQTRKHRNKPFPISENSSSKKLTIIYIEGKILSSSLLLSSSLFCVQVKGQWFEERIKIEMHMRKQIAYASLTSAIITRSRHFLPRVIKSSSSVEPFDSPGRCSIAVFD